jgi:hypothetical protein
MPLGRLVTAATRNLRGPLAQLGYEAFHQLLPAREFFRLALHLRRQNGHQAQPTIANEGSVTNQDAGDPASSAARGECGGNRNIRRRSEGGESDPLRTAQLAVRLYRHGYRKPRLIVAD